MSQPIKAFWTLVSGLFVAQGAWTQQGLLWRVSGHGHTGFVYGTMHTSDSIANSMDSTVYNALYQCNTLLLEGDMGTLPNSETMVDVMRMNQTTLSDLYSPSEFTEVNAYLESHLGTLGMLLKDELCPIFIMLMLQQQSEFKRTEMAQEQFLEEAMDMRFYQLAKQHGIAAVGLEAWSEQMEKVSSIDLQSQAQLLLETTRGKYFSNVLVDDMVGSYYRQDLNEMAEAIDTTDALQMKMYERILFDRNDRFVERALPYFTNGSTFMAVGALHLAGDRSVLAMLRSSGFTVERVPFAFLKYMTTK
jgi:uncharacterized protein